MNKALKNFLACSVVLIAVFLLSQISTEASTKVYTTTINLDRSDNYEGFDMVMPKDGKVKINAAIKDIGTVPGILTVAIQKDYKEGSAKVKEITGITAAAPVTDLEVELSEGKYYITYKLSNATGDLADTEISLNCTTEIMPTAAVNMPELKVSSVNSFNDLSEQGYSVLKFGDGEQDSDKNIVVSFTVKNGGGVDISMVPGNGGFDEITGTIYRDKECTSALGKSFSLDGADESANFIRTLTGSGTYYIKFTLENVDYEAVGETDFFVKLYDLNGADRVITVGKSTLAYQDKADKKINYKISVKTKSYLTVDVDLAISTKAGTATFRLLDNNKKVITKNSKVYNYQRSDSDEYGVVKKYYTVPAGTYYIQVTTSNSIYQLNVSSVKAGSNAGSSKDKAKLLKVQKTYAMGYFTIADSITKADWYKFTVDSRQLVQIYMKYVLDGKFDFEILNSKGKVLYKLSKGAVGSEGCYQTTYTDYFDEGTYYIKVYKTGASSSVSYILQLFNYEYIISNK